MVKTCPGSLGCRFLLLITLFLPSVLVGQTYRIVDVGVAAGNPCDICCTEVRAWGINSLGEVVGDLSCDGPDLARPFFWLPTAAYGFSGEQPILIEDADGGAHEINTQGVVAGWSGSGQIPGATTSDAVVWELGIPRPRLIAKTVLPAPAYVAWAVNDLDPDFQVVGDFMAQSVDRGFLWTVGDPALTTLPPAGGHPRSRARDLSTPPDQVPTVGGRSFQCDPGESFCPSCPAAIGDATAWDSLPIEMLQPPGFETDTGDDEITGEARGVNDLENLVGWGMEKASCRTRALYWDDPLDAVPTNLSAAAAPGCTNDLASLLNHRANAVNNVDPRRAVGTELTFNVPDRAFLWQLQDPNGADNPTDWCAVDLDTQISPACDWNLDEATDIATVAFHNQTDDWIVGWGRHDGAVRGFVLIPLGDCPWDTNGDGVVDVQDLVAVQLGWGPCAAGSLCLADTNGDCSVDAQDLVAVNLNWGVCP